MFIIKLRLISAPCLILPEVGSDATFTVATDAEQLVNYVNYAFSVNR
jgi:hypothetical protein